MITQRIFHSFISYPEKTAFVISGQCFTYYFVQKRVNTLSSVLLSQTVKGECIGVFVTDNIDTYTAILACWFTGRVFVPLSPAVAANRNAIVIENAEISFAFAAEPNLINHTFSLLTVFDTSLFTEVIENVEFPVIESTDLAYILFTSGSTGQPKGVPISHGNIDAFINAFINLNLSIDENDRFLQMYDLTFDASLQTYCLPLCIGASIYTVGNSQLKYLQAIKLMRNAALTVIKMVPSTLIYLRPYFKQIALPEAKLCLFGGEQLSQSIVNKWADCVPNAQIHNVYGPSETTVNCLFHKWNKSDSGSVVPIGKPYGDSTVICIDENLQPISKMEIGELCVSGSQVFNGYWNLPERSAQAFINYNNKRYYRTGDLVKLTETGEYEFCGRVDNQVKINGFRIELEEIERTVWRLFTIRSIAFIKKAHSGSELLLAVENTKITEPELFIALKNNLAYYMLPSRIVMYNSFPEIVSGKIDRQSISLENQ